MLSPHQETVLAETLESLLAYANQSFGIVRDDYLSTDLVERESQRMLIARTIWNNPCIIETFVDANPDQLSQEHLEAAQNLRHAFKGNIVVHSLAEGVATVSCRLGLFEVQIPQTAPESWLLPGPLSGAGIIASFQGLIVPILGLETLGRLTDSQSRRMRARLAAHGFATACPDGATLAARAKDDESSRESARAEEPPSSDDEYPWPRKGCHCGTLTGLTGKAREEVCKAHFDRKAHEEGCALKAVEPYALKGIRIPHTLEEGLRLLDYDWLEDIAENLTDALPYGSLSREDLLALLADRLPHDQDLCGFSLIWSDQAQLDLVRLLLGRGPFSLAELSPSTAVRLRPMVPYTFILSEGNDLKAWMPPEIHALVSQVDLKAIDHIRDRLREATYTARGLATICGIVSMDEAYTSYCKAVASPFEREEFEIALEQGADMGDRDDYALWDHGGTSYLVASELADASAEARVARRQYPNRIQNPDCELAGVNTPTLLITEEEEREMRVLVCQERKRLERQRISLLHHRDDQLVSHALPQTMLSKSPIQALMDLDALQALRNYLDRNVPDGEDDYTLPDLVTRAVVVSSVLMRDSIDDVIDVARIFHAYDEDKEVFPDDIGRLITNAYNALPRWQLRGWSLEENTERLTGRRHFYHANGTLRHIGDTEPCPCGSGRTYGTCCGRLPPRKRDGSLADIP